MSQDFSLINSRITFHDGCIVDILDDYSETYLIEFLEKDDYSEDWLQIKGYHGIQKYHYLHFSPKQYAVNWRINIYGWKDDRVKQRLSEVATNIAEIKGADLGRITDLEADEMEHINRIKDKLSLVEKILSEEGKY